MNSRLLIMLFILGIGAIAAGWIYQSKSRIPDAQAELEIPDNIDYFLTNLRFRVIDDKGKLDYQFRSRRMEHQNRTDTSHIERPSLQIYRDSEWQVDSLKAEFQHAQNLLHLQNQVVLKRLGDNPMQVQTESLQFEPERDLVTSEGSLLMTTDKARIEAEQAVFDLSGRVYSLKKTRVIYFNVNG